MVLDSDLLPCKRFASKVANHWATAELLNTLAPRQLGFGVRGGAEPIVHAAKAFVSSSSPFHALVMQSRRISAMLPADRQSADTA